MGIAPNVLKNIFLLFCIVLFCSCSSVNTGLSHHNYVLTSYNHYIYNDSANITFTTPADLDIKSTDIYTKHKVAKLVKGTPALLNVNKIILHGTTTVSPINNVFIFYEDTFTGNDQPIHYNDSVNNIVLLEKIKNRKKISVLVKGISPENSINSAYTDAKQIWQNIEIDSLNREKLLPFSILNTYSDVVNPLLITNKILKSPVILNKNEEWIKNQLLLTQWSFISNSTDYLKAIAEQEDKRKKRYEKVLDSIKGFSGVITGNKVYSSIGTLALAQNIILLNENHWYPKHRIFAYNLLEELKKAGYTHIAIEALENTPEALKKH